MNSIALLLNTININKKNLNIEIFSDEDIQMAIDSGMGAYLNYCIYNTKTTKLYKKILSADLTAKIITNTQLRALQEIINITAGSVDEIILMKGISICQNYYPHPHFRIMGDIDLLVSEKDQSTIENALLKIGYQQELKSSSDNNFFKTHHHSIPFYNKINNVWVEVHTHLFSQSSFAIKDNLFDLKNIKNNCIPVNNKNYSVKIKCLRPELQLIHTCAHWAEDFNINKGLIQMVDMMLIIKNNNKGLDWKNVLDSVNNTVSASYLYIILEYFKKNKINLNQPDYSRYIELKYSNMGYLNKSILFFIIDRFLHKKRFLYKFINENILEIMWYTLLQPKASFFNIIVLPWNILFPPHIKSRYNFSFLIRRIIHMSKP